MNERNQAEIVAFLADPATYGLGAGEVGHNTTHGAHVFLAGADAYKLKRAVTLPYLDYGTAERREAACRAELEVNRRTAPGIYLGVEPVVRRADGGLAIGGARRRRGGTPVGRQATTHACMCVCARAHVRA